MGFVPLLKTENLLDKQRAQGDKELGEPVEAVEPAVFLVVGHIAEALHGQDAVTHDEANAGDGKEYRAEAGMSNKRADCGCAHEAAHEGIYRKRDKELAHIEIVLLRVAKLNDESEDDEGNSGDPRLGSYAV